MWLSVTVDDENGRLLRSGEPLEEIVALADKYPLEAILINCSVPEAIVQSMEIYSNSKIPFGAYANGFTNISDAFKEINATVDKLDARTDLNPEKYANFADQWVNAGATLIGGCCEVGPAHIDLLRDRFSSAN